MQFCIWHFHHFLQLWIAGSLVSYIVIWVLKPVGVHSKQKVDTTWQLTELSSSCFIGQWMVLVMADTIYRRYCSIMFNIDVWIWTRLKPPLFMLQLLPQSGVSTPTMNTSRYFSVVDVLAWYTNNRTLCWWWIMAISTSIHHAISTYMFHNCTSIVIFVIAYTYVCYSIYICLL